MLVYLIRRILAVIPVMLVVAIFVFALFFMMPGDPAINMAGENATSEDIANIRRSMGLDLPFYIRFWVWFAAILQGDLGKSVFTGVPVVQLIAQRLEPTISLSICALLISVVVALPIGIAAAWKSGSLLDRLVMAGAVLGFSVPAFIIGYLLVFIFSIELEWLPVQGFASLSEGIVPFAEHIILPSITISVVMIALIARVTRAAMMEVLTQDYVRTAHAKGVRPIVILGVHALKNSAVPIVTVIGLAVASLIGGVIVTETVFALPGLGVLTVDAITRRDYPVIQGVVLMFSAVYVAINLLVDLTYRIFDPRIRY